MSFYFCFVLFNAQICAYDNQTSFFGSVCVTPTTQISVDPHQSLVGFS
jgi:hypothetical protein